MTQVQLDPEVEKGSGLTNLFTIRMNTQVLRNRVYEVVMIMARHGH